ncbi:MAG TPA: CHRD domain-containing protein [Flavobacterium sp.]|nr:CHRD domain-containing protein [Flavobacterium sp.]
MKLLYKFSAILVFLLVSISCNSDSDDSYPNPTNTTTFKATLNGSSEVPSNSSAAMGNATLTLNNTTKMFTLSGTYTGMTPTVSHIHGPAMVGVNAVPLFDLIVTPTPGYNYGAINLTSSIALTTAQEADLMGNLYYVNVHSTAYLSGEIRGQLIKQ